MPTYLRKLENWTPKPLLRAVVLTRVSSDMQNPESPDDQERDCLARVKSEGWQHVGTFHDREVTGATEWREGFQKILSGLQRGDFDIIVAESLARISRDQEDSAALYKRACFAEVIIFTLVETEIEDWHVGIKSIINAAYLQQLATDTRRGLRGRIVAGASAGGLSYGYDVVSVPEGEKRGKRTIHSAQAAVVVRVFDLYAKGVSPKKIASMLNEEGVPAPRGNAWSQSTINGNRKRGTGILNNELYHGYLIWNRLRYIKHPDTDKRRSRPNTPDKIVCVEVPDLRIVTADQWDAVRDRQVDLDVVTSVSNKPAGFWSKQRPKYLLSGLMQCGVCRGGFSMISATHVGCSNARNKGQAVCTYKRTIKRSVIEATVLDGLSSRLMRPDIYESFMRGFLSEWNREQGSRDGEQVRKRDELKRLEKKVRNLVEAIAENGSSAALLAALKDVEDRKLAVERELSIAETPAPRFLPNLADVYQAKVFKLQEALEEDDAGAARELLRNLIDKVRVTPCPGDTKAQPTIEVRGELAAMLALGSGSSEAAASALASQLKLVAGAGFEPAAFRL
ncbi:MAG: recombinase family protein [Janthinobacterium lividum]